MVKKGETPTIVPVAKNPKAFHHFELLEEYEAGLALKGPEVKSLRNGKASLEGSFARIENGEAVLHHCHIAPYKQNTVEDLRPDRPRKLLLKHGEIGRLAGKSQLKGLSIVPLEIYFKRGWAKVRLALAKGKRGPDRREAIRRRDVAREMERSFKGKLKV